MRVTRGICHMETEEIKRMLESTKELLNILLESEARYREEADTAVATLLVDCGVMARIEDIMKKAEAKCELLQKESERLRNQLELMEAMLRQTDAKGELLHGLDISRLDPATAHLVRLGHLPTITHLGGHIENAAQSEDYAVAQA